MPQEVMGSKYRKHNEIKDQKLVKRIFLNVEDFCIIKYLFKISFWQCSVVTRKEGREWTIRSINFGCFKIQAIVNILTKTENQKASESIINIDLFQMRTEKSEKYKWLKNISKNKKVVFSEEIEIRFNFMIILKDRVWIVDFLKK